MQFDLRKTNRIKRFAGMILATGSVAAAFGVPEVMTSWNKGAELLQATMLGNVGAPVLAMLLGSLILLNSPKKRE